MNWHTESTVRELFPLCHTETNHTVHRDTERMCAQNKGLYFAFHQIKILGVGVIKKEKKPKRIEMIIRSIVHGKCWALSQVLCVQLLISLHLYIVGQRN